MSQKIDFSLTHRLAELFPGGRVEAASALGETLQEGAGTTKSIGYGQPVRIDLTTAAGDKRQLVFHLAQSNDFGHNRRADRAADALLAFDTMSLIPGQAAVVDVGAVCGDELRSLSDSGEFYTITEYLEGETYADTLSAIGKRGRLIAEDIERCDSLVDYLARLHADKIDSPGSYRRAIRDLVGHGEGIFGLVDSFPEGVPGAPLSRIDALEFGCVEWRRRLHGCEARLSRTHGDFHPFNILFNADRGPLLLDASRGCIGDPADDATCLAVNYLFFGLEHSGSGAGAFGPLWDRFWERYLDRADDPELLAVAPPFLAWRVLVLTNPGWYPNVAPETREALLGLAETSLKSGRLDPAAALSLIS